MRTGTYIVLVFIFILSFTATELYAAETGLKGFAASDISTDGSYLYVAKGRYIYRSNNAAKTQFDLFATLPESPNMHFAYPYKTFTLFIPHRVAGETADRMFVSWYGSNNLYMCADLSATSPVFTSVIYHDHVWSSGGVDYTDGCVLGGVTEDREGNLYAGWYHLEPGYGAHLYKSTDRGATWDILRTFDARHIHQTKVNPYNNWLYVITGEPYTEGGADNNGIFRSKDGGESFTKIYSNAFRPTHIPMEFYNNTVIIGTDVNCSNYDPGKLNTFIDDGSNGPFTLTTIYSTDGGCYDSFFGQPSWLGNKLYFATGSDYASEASAFGAKLVSTTDLVNVTVENTATVYPSDITSTDLGHMTIHAHRGNITAYALNATTGYVVNGPTTAPEAHFMSRSESASTGESIAFVDLSINGPSSWSWNFGDGSTSTARNPEHTYQTTGTYTVTLTATNVYGEDTYSDDVEVGCSNTNSTLSNGTLRGGKL